MVNKKTLEIYGDFNIKINADEVKIERVVINLIQNAVKYAPGSAVSIKGEKLPGIIKIIITD